MPSAPNPVAPVAEPQSTEPTTKQPGMLDKDGFLKLLVAQLKSQDPMSAVSNEEIMGQMTQLSMVEQVTNLTKANEELVNRMQTSQALGLIGRTVAYTTDDGAPGTGTVEKVVFDEGVATLTVGDVSGIDPANVAEVE
jgi:flagellar basal-body rod modification protein FlgD